jgi:hypothetical protein
MNPRIEKLTSVAGAAGLTFLLLLAPACRRPDPGSFATPEEAVKAVHDVAGTGDTKRVEEIFGPGSMEIFRSGDATADAEAAARVKAMIAEKVAFEEFDAVTKVALLGEAAWPFPIPLVQAEKRWKFDTQAGKQELLNRRIGFNELSTLASLHEYVDAQREYHADGKDGNPPAYAQKVFSSEGKRDGLYWPTGEDEAPSPLGDLLAAAAKTDTPEPDAFHGYFYRILTGQGKNAPGGERSYLDAKGLMTGGFAAVAWPAKYGNSGVMTFLVSSRDIVYQKDLGAGTAELAKAITAFDPDSTWEATRDSIAMVEDDGEDESEGEQAAEVGDAEAAAKPGV